MLYLLFIQESSLFPLAEVFSDMLSVIKELLMFLLCKGGMFILFDYERIYYKIHTKSFSIDDRDIFDVQLLQKSFPIYYLSNNIYY